jgi:hypothetical protein
VAAIERERIRAYVPPSMVGSRPGLFADTDFVYDPTADVSHCPGEKVVRFLSQSDVTHRRISQAPATDCTGCSLREHGTTSPRGRRISRNFDETYLARVRGYHATEP